MIQFESSHGIATFTMEAIVGMSGHIVPPKEYLKIIREICDGVLFITDWVWPNKKNVGYIQHYDVVPDIMIMT